MSNSSKTTQVISFELQARDEALEDLRDRRRRTRWPERDTVSSPDQPDWSQGPPLAYVQQLAAAWEAYDWRHVESELNAQGQATTEIDRLDVHFLHVRSPRSDVRMLIITRGWPGSVLEPLQVMDALADPEDSAMSAFHVDIEKIPRSWFESHDTDLHPFRSARRGGYFVILEVPHNHVDELRLGLGALPW